MTAARPALGPRPIALLVALSLALALMPFAAIPVAAANHVWINEFHYDNTGTDTDERIEVAGAAGTDLTGWSLVLYNGANGLVYDTDALSGTIPDQENGFGTVFVTYPVNGIQNGAPDGMALVDASGAVAQFLSYEGTLTALGGPAEGMTSTDIGVSQSGSGPVGNSLQLTGSGTAYDEFTWAAEQPHTFGAVNAGQSFGGVVNQPVVVDCGPTLGLLEGDGGSRTVSASDADGTVTSIDITGVDPDPGTITIGATSPAAGVGESASAEVSIGAGTPVGSYAVSISATNDDADPQTGSCTLNVTVSALLTVGAVQGQVLDTDDGRTHASPLVGQQVFVRGVVTQRIQQLTSSGGTNYSFFIQDAADAADDDPLTSDGILVFIGGFQTVLNVTFGEPAYFPQVGDVVVLRANVAEFFNFTELTSPRFVSEEVDQGDLEELIDTPEVAPPPNLADAYRYWERHEGMRVSVPEGAMVTGSRDVFASTADGEVWVIRGDDPLAERADPYARRVFRDPHPLDDEGPAGSFDNGNGTRILLVSHGLKWAAGDSDALIAPARTFDTVTNAATGGVFFSFGKYGIEVESQLALAGGVDPSDNAPPAAHDDAAEYATAPYNVENLYDFRDDPFDGCDFAGNPGCPGVSPPFNYVPTSAEAYEAHIGALADQIVSDLHAPNILLIQEAEDQDICAVVAATLDCDDGVDDRDGRPDTLQELALAIAAAGGPPYDAAYDRDGADDRGIVSAFLYRTDRVELLPPDPNDPVLGGAPSIEYSAPGLAYNADVQNPKALNAHLPDGVALGDGCDELPDGRCVFTRDPQVAAFRVWRHGIGTSVFSDVYAVSNHFSSTPDARVAQRTEQAAYNAAIVSALTSADDGARVVVGGDFNVFPRPDDPFPPPATSDQLAALYEIGLHSLWETVLADEPASAYSYVFEGQAQTLDNQFVTDALMAELNAVRYAHVNADFPAGHEGDGSRGASDHDPQVARYDGLPTIDRLRDLVTYYVDAGMIDSGKAKQLTDRLDRAERFYARGMTGAGDAQLVAFGEQAQDFVPAFVDPVAADTLQAEALLFIEVR